jgi:hypothetical protein
VGWGGSSSGEAPVVSLPLPPSARRPAPAAGVGRAEVDRPRMLVSALRARQLVREAPLEAQRNVEVKMDLRYVRVDVGPMAPSLYLGLAGGWMVLERGAVELDAGWNQQGGYRLAPLFRYHLAVTHETFMSLALGPSLSLRSQTLGNRIPDTGNPAVDRSGLFYYLAANPELAFGIYGRSGVIIDLGIGGLVRLAENYSSLCPNGGARGCGDEVDDEGKSIWKKTRPYLRVGLGGHF